jgi:hypothetical protein
MAVNKRPAPKRLSKAEKLAAWLIKPGGLSEILKPYDTQRIEWLEKIAKERGLKPQRTGLYGIAEVWLFELAYDLAREIYDGSSKRGRRLASPLDNFEQVLKWRKLRQQYPNDSDRRIAARVLDISLKSMDSKRNKENNKKIQTLCKRYKKAEIRLRKLGNFSV